MEVCRFHFPFAANKRKLPFSVSSFFHVYILYIFIYCKITSGGISTDVIWGKKLKGEGKKGENVKEKGRRGREKGRKGKGKDKRGSKRVK
jgi:hypothetical protein